MSYPESLIGQRPLQMRHRTRGKGAPLYAIRMRICEIEAPPRKMGTRIPLLD